MRRTPRHAALLAVLLSVLGGCPDEPPKTPRTPDADAGAPEVPAPAPRADGRLPPLAAPVRYAIALDVDPTTPRFQGTETIDVDVPAPTPWIVLHGRALTITSVRALAGDPATAITGTATFRTPQGGKAPEELVLHFARPLPAGRVAIELAWNAPFDDELSGLYRVKEGERWYAFTQFEATDARRAFPSFDEPGFKVPFDVTITTPQPNVAVANAPESARETTADGKSRFRFATTQPLPTYLVAFAVGDFDFREATRSTKPKIRLVTTKGKSDLGALALEATSTMLDALESWLSVPYPYEKLDIVAVPDFSPGGMENAGLITFRDERLLLDPSRASIAARRVQANVIAHELAHQWFGDLVTAAWWNDLWLNEGMATWMQWRLVERVRPSFGARLDAATFTHTVMDVDGLASARAIRQPVVSTSDAQSAFDGITYEKGAAVLATIEKWVGEQPFQRGLAKYLKENAHKSVDASRLLGALDAATGKNVSAMASSYLDVPGVPEITAHPACERGARWFVELSQEPWRPVGSKLPEESDRTWTVPVCIRAQGEKKDVCTDLVAGAPAIVAGQGRCPTFFHPNPTDAYYRFALDDKELTKLAAARTQLDPALRLSALASAWASVRSGRLPPGALLKALPAFDDETARQVVDRVVFILYGMSEALVDDEARPAFRKFVAARLAKRKKALGWYTKPSAETAADDAVLRRSVMIAMADLAEDDATLSEADDYARRWLADPASVDADTAAVALDLASRRAGEDRLTALREAAKNAKTREDRIIALRAMGGFRDPDLLRRALGIILTDEVRAPEVRYLLGAAFSRREARDITEAWVREHWDELTKKLPGSLSRSLLGGTSVGCSKTALQERQAFYGPRVANIEGAERTLSEALEAISLCTALRNQAAPQLTKALTGKK